MIPGRFLRLITLFLAVCATASGQESKYGLPRTGNGSSVGRQEAPAAPGPADTLIVRDLVNRSIVISAAYPDSAIHLLQEALTKSRTLRYEAGIAASLANMGRLSNVGGDYDAAIRYYRIAEPHAIKGLRSRTSLAMFYNCMSGPFFNKAQFDSMYRYVTLAERLVSGITCQNVKEVKEVSAIYNNIALLWSGVGNYQRTMTYLHRSRRTILSYTGKKEGLEQEAAIVNSNIGLMHLEQNAYDSAEFYLHQSMGVQPEITLTVIGLGRLQAHYHNPKEAAALFRKAIQLAERANDYTNMIGAKARLGGLLYEQGDLKQAKIYLNEVLRQSGNKGNLDLENSLHAYEILAAIAEQEGDYKLAYAQKQKSLELLNAQKIKEKMLSVYALESELGIANRDKDLAKQQLLLSRTRNRFTLWMIAGGAGLAVLGGLLFILYRKFRNRQRSQQKVLNSVKQDQEIKSLQSMIKGEEKERARMAREIHDGIMVQFSTIKMKMKSVPESYKDMDCAAYLSTDYYRQLVDQMEDATRDLRSTAHNLMPDMLLEGGLEDAVLYFCNSLRRDTALEIEFQKHGTLPPLDKEYELSIYRIIQELLQNAIKHADASHILVQLAILSDNLLTITIEDNGKGFDPAKAIEGLGLVSIKNRLRVMHGFIDIDSRPGKGTSVHLEFDHLFFSAPVLQ
ncbi:sensor histidine kinase [Taibaiella chishuiensis]|uniref:histidine kinase n=1 Tax=Taibaiella chishuiensis TaxID=1434707 RepID=A0A2P8D205_9BACT|nr:sensor histidine kinase [Taibaiella chishuiensis]PSK91254.1 histidine kinase [Taibaiella chishuiensis]